MGLQEGVWQEFAERTASRTPLEFFQHALVAIDGEDGAGRMAVDIGCGSGSETRALLDRGWSVFALDSEPRAIDMLIERVPDCQTSRLETVVAAFTEVDLPPADLVYAQLSLPFAANRFVEATIWALEAVVPGGWFVGQFLGPSDTWASEDDVAVVAKTDVEAFFVEFDRVDILEEEFEGHSGAVPKHWHWYRVEARRGR